MSQKKVFQKPTLAYTSNPDYRKPPKIANPVSNLLHCMNGIYSSLNFIKTSIYAENSHVQRVK